MANFLKKALGVFVEFEDDSANSAKPAENTVNAVRANPVQTGPISTGPIPGPVAGGRPMINQEDLEKFSRHFDTLFEKANAPGPDYYEFFKMMETLEAHIPDEKARMSAVFATLAIQGLTKQKLIESAGQYKLIVDKDRSDFDSAVNDKANKDIESRKKSVEDLEKKVVTNSELIQKLTKEITEAQFKIATLKNEMLEEQNKLSAKTGSYKVASEAMINKITSDIQKLQTNL